MNFPLAHRKTIVIDEPEIVGFEPPRPLWRRALRRATAVVAVAGLAAMLFAVGAVVTVVLGIALLIFAVSALLGARMRIVVRRR